MLASVLLNLVLATCSGDVLRAPESTGESEADASESTITVNGHAYWW
jgi:hypothetical protein